LGGAVITLIACLGSRISEQIVKTLLLYCFSPLPHAVARRMGLLETIRIRGGDE
jgi:hypothetical protein